MIVLFGDQHGDFHAFQKKVMNRSGLNLTEGDYVIILGDAAILWDEKSLKSARNIFDSKPYTVLWIQGNHENYDIIETYPVEMWHGGKVRHIVKDKIILLERGQIFDIDGKTFFTFGGAQSHDMSYGVLDRNDPDYRAKVKIAKRTGQTYRVIHRNWWPQEMPSDSEYEEGGKNLSACGKKVDFILTHCCSTSMQNNIAFFKNEKYEANRLTDYFEAMEAVVDYDHWYFGHYHVDMFLDEKHTVLYKTFVVL